MKKRLFVLSSEGHDDYTLNLNSFFLENNMNSNEYNLKLRVLSAGFIKPLIFHTVVSFNSNFEQKFNKLMYEDAYLAEDGNVDYKTFMENNKSLIICGPSFVENKNDDFIDVYFPSSEIRFYVATIDGLALEATDLEDNKFFLNIEFIFSKK